MPKHSEEGFSVGLTVQTGAPVAVGKANRIDMACNVKETLRSQLKTATGPNGERQS